MKNYIRINNKKTIWPYSLFQLRIDEPKISLSNQPHTEEIQALVDLDPPIYVFEVSNVTPPNINQRTERLMEVHPEEVGGKWIQRWEIVSATEDEISSFDKNNAPKVDYIGFWDSILLSNVYSALYQNANVSLPTNTALTAFIAAFNDAKMGRPNINAIQACIYLVMMAASEILTVEYINELQELMDAHNLSIIFTLTAPE